MGRNAHTKILCTQAPIKSQKLAADKHIGCQGQKKHVAKRQSQSVCQKKLRLHTTWYRRRRSHHVSQKTTVHTTCHKRRRYTPRVTKTTVHTTCHNGQRLYTNVAKDSGHKPYVTKDGGYKPYVTNAAKTVCQRRWLQTICQTHVKFSAITPNGAKCKLLLNTCTMFYYITVNSYIS